MLTLENFIPTLHHFISAACAVCIDSLHNREIRFTRFTHSNVLHVHGECTLPDQVILILSDPPLLRSTESSKPQSPSKRLSMSRGIKQLFQSATKFVRLLQR